ncbi:NHL repeat-containing protein [Chitinophaga agri]|uniref:Uncharacterized protein n=1 Tax=Chitinophaga agri TaxID=2703787 RepID=A0A6B9ZMB2_9BACT|nr:hypothetical protein [Chitinophaga agri]QHS63590.1 hypothetical protein GWR21_29620 [Chitinophaga agri]
MSTKAVRFHVEVKDVEITSGHYIVHAIAPPADFSAQQHFTGNTFEHVISGGSQYFAVSVVITSYKQHGQSYSCAMPVSLLATFTLPDAVDVKVCPESSVASIYTFAGMAHVDAHGNVRIAGTERNMKIAYGMKQQLYRTEGIVADMIRQSPNGFETNSYPMFNSLCNLFYYCLTDTKFYEAFLGCVWHPEDVKNENFLQALRHLLHDPFTGASAIYRLLADRPEIYKDSLISMNLPEDRKVPDNWTLTLKLNSSGSKNFIPSGSAFVVFDADDNAWIANNFRAGSGDSGTHCPVYKYDGTPASFSPVQGGGLLGVAFGAAIDPAKAYISFGNFGWGSEYNNPQQGSISRFHKDGRPVSPANGFTIGLSRVQGMEYDRHGNLWMASVGCQDPFAPAPAGLYPFTSEPSAVVVYLKQDDPEKEPARENVVICDEFPIKHTSTSDPVYARTPYLKIFDVTPDNKGNAYVSCIGNYDSEHPDQCVVAAVYKVALEQNRLVVKCSWYSEYTNTRTGQTGYESLRQVAIDGDGNIVVVGVASSRATVLHPDTLKKITYYDVETYNPWGVKIDRKKTVFLANFGRDEGERAGDHTLDLQARFGVTMLRDPADPASAKLLTLPTGGSEVMLANGHPLYGNQTRPGKPILLVKGEPVPTPVRMKCYQPIMRLTSTNIDGAGNLWCMNNWKPAALVDVLSNPGGDGVVIFLGIAAPE